MKKTSIAPANIAFIKYWGKIDANQNIPVNDSISMNLSACLTTTTVEFDKKYKKDEISYVTKEMSKDGKERVIRHLDRIRKIAKSSLYAKVVTTNSFPSSCGIASSASGFASLSKAATAALNLDLSEKDLSNLSRFGSGSACRSIPDGFTYWKKGKKSEDSYAYSLKPANWWNICDIIVIVSEEKKKISSGDGHKRVNTSPYFKTRVKNLPNKIKGVKDAMKEKNMKKLGKIIEEEAVDLHLIAMSSTPPIFYWEKETLDVIKRIQLWREEGIEVYFTIDAGPNVHILCEGHEKENVLEKLKTLPYKIKTIINVPAKGVRQIENHLF